MYGCWDGMLSMIFMITTKFKSFFFFFLVCGEKETFGESLKGAMTIELRGAESLVHFTINNEGAWYLYIYII